MNELVIYRTLHCLLAVVRVANELRNAVESFSGAADPSGGSPYKIDGLDTDTLEHFQALAEALSALERSVPVQRWRRASRTRPEDVSRETYPAPFMGPDSVEDSDDA